MRRKALFAAVIVNAVGAFSWLYVFARTFNSQEHWKPAVASLLFLFCAFVCVYCLDAYMERDK